jgi:hypothetical protein
MSTIRDIRELLASIEAPGAFATRRATRADDLRLEVKGVGRIRWPISRTTARRLCATARPARYGLKDQTQFDPRVRDTFEIPKTRVRIDKRRWRDTFRPMLDRARRDLGLPDGTHVRAELHNMLVYGPGQFVVTHQDSEKSDDMIGTLVVILPSAFTGGAMVIEHHDEQVAFRAAGGKLTFIAFYADCHHQVRPVTAGYRVALTYNLMVDGDMPRTIGSAAAAHLDALAQSIERFFETPLPRRWAHEPRREPPDRLVYLLDHQYTRRSLAWNRLKNGDAVRAQVLREVARRLDCESVLALADVHENWSCEDEGFGYGLSVVDIAAAHQPSSLRQWIRSRTRAGPVAGREAVGACRRAPEEAPRAAQSEARARGGLPHEQGDPRPDREQPDLEQPPTCTTRWRVS